ncbi:conserved Plasmodium protein, unknown function [Plasmodium ovale wallikeri]|uniref:Uncharacterized protein n=1 Tax=Plasmodium ovale wallikeri TaxID=864142 RepID=A0A1A8Z4F0_PLAOA|nr:conserved Plasmodium protein, unknown function [Plasmodium ovale wallikeri]
MDRIWTKNGQNMDKTGQNMDKKWTKNGQKINSKQLLHTYCHINYETSNSHLMFLHIFLIVFTTKMQRSKMQRSKMQSSKMQSSKMQSSKMQSSKMQSSKMTKRQNNKIIRNSST